MEETLGGEVKAELEAFAGNKSKHETINAMLRSNVSYVIQAPVQDWDLFCYLGYRLRTSDGYPLAYVTLHLQSGAVGKEVQIAALKRIARRDGWEGHDLEESETWARVLRTMSLASVFREEDHVATLQRFFVESIRQLDEELITFKAQVRTKNVLEELVKSESALELDSQAFGDFIIRFAVRGWDAPALLTSENWTSSRRILLFEFWNAYDNLQLKLIIGPGPDEVRRKLLDLARANPEVFDAPRNYVDSYYEILSLTILDRRMYEDADGTELTTELRRHWSHFLEENLPRIDAILKEEVSIWEPGEGSDPLE